MSERANKRMELTKRGPHLKEGSHDHPFFIESRFAAHPRCSADREGTWDDRERSYPDHSTDEGRFIPIGVTPSLRLLVVVHADRADRIRIISARPATRAEQKRYEESQEPGR